jgi:hypothetical protein
MDDERQGGGGGMQNQGRGRGRMAMGNLVLSVVGSGGGGSKEYLSIVLDSLLPCHCYLFDTNFESLGSGLMLQCLRWLAEMDTAFTAYSLASTGTLSGGPSHVPSSNPLGGPRVEVSISLECKCKKKLTRGNLMATMVMLMREEEI